MNLGCDNTAIITTPLRTIKKFRDEQKHRSGFIYLRFNEWLIFCIADGQVDGAMDLDVFTYIIILHMLQNTNKLNADTISNILRIRIEKVAQIRKISINCDVKLNSRCVDFLIDIYLYNSYVYFGLELFFFFFCGLLFLLLLFPWNPIRIDFYLWISSLNYKMLALCVFVFCFGLLVLMMLMRRHWRWIGNRLTLFIFMQRVSFEW